MLFENKLHDEPTAGQQVRAHLPIIVGVAAVGVLFVGLHLAAMGIVVAAAAHLLALVVAWQVRRHRPRSS